MRRPDLTNKKTKTKTFREQPQRAIQDTCHIETLITFMKLENNNLNIHCYSSKSVTWNSICNARDICILIQQINEKADQPELIPFVPLKRLLTLSLSFAKRLSLKWRRNHYSFIWAFGFRKKHFPHVSWVWVWPSTECSISSLEAIPHFLAAIFPYYSEQIFPYHTDIYYTDQMLPTKHHNLKEQIWSQWYAYKIVPKWCVQ